jgi:hypothetical protein
MMLGGLRTRSVCGFYRETPIAGFQSEGRSRLTPEQGAERIKFHGAAEEGSFLRMLRPFRGLDDKIFDDLEVALHAAAPLLSKPLVEKELMSALWAICYLGRFWALSPGGMIQRNKLMKSYEAEKLQKYLDRISFAVMTLLDGCSLEIAFEDEVAE